MELATSQAVKQPEFKTPDGWTLQRASIEGFQIAGAEPELRINCSFKGGVSTLVGLEALRFLLARELDVFNQELKAARKNFNSWSQQERDGNYVYSEWTWNSSSITFPGLQMKVTANSNWGHI